MGRTTLLPFAPPCIGKEEIAEVIATLESGWITTGPKVRRFEEDFARLLGAPSTLAVSSGTAALHLGLLVAGVGPGDAVVTSPLTFCSAVHVIEHVGAKPILVDVESETLNLDLSQVEAALARNQRVRALLPVHLYGHPCDMNRLLAIARTHRLTVIEDAAHAIGARYNGKLIGAPLEPEVVDLVAYSFYATKNITTIEGGMLTGPADLIAQARTWSLHGMSRDAYKRYSAEGSWFYEVTVPGYKYNMSDVQAAVGIHQLKQFPEMQARRKQIVALYNDGLADLDTITLPTERPEAEHAWHLYVVRLNLERLTIDRARFIEELKWRNIASSVHFIPVHLHPYYRDKYGYKPDNFPVAYAEYQRIVSLPLYPGMTDRDATDVIEAVQDVVARYRR